MKREDLVSRIKALEKENKLLRFVLDSIHEGVLVTDEKDRIIVYNQEAENTEGLSRNEMVGKVEEDAYGHVLGYNFDQLFTKAVRESGKPIVNAYHQYDIGHGNKTAILFNVLPYCENGEVAAVCTIGRNINQIKDFIVDTLEINNRLNMQNGKETSGAKYFLDDIIGESAAMKRLITQAKKIAKRDSPILIYGETGTGKELLASGIHNHSLFSSGPFITVNCAAIPDTLLESTLFGVTKGAFTGAVESPGLFEQANNGTLFLDEINSMPINLQAKLLRVIQEKSIRRIGGTNEILVNCRIISATNKRPKEMVDLGVIREDLFFRLSTIELKIPSLRERKEDIEYLLGYFIRKYNIRFGLFIEGVSWELEKILLQYDWPGNVRELENMVESSMNLVETKERILMPRHLSDYFIDKFKELHAYEPSADVKQQMQKRLMSYEKGLYEELLVKNNYNVAKIAKDFGVTRQNVYIRLKRLGISLPNSKSNNS